MLKLATAAKRILVGRPFRSDRLSQTLLPKRVALPVFASDPMSSVAYAPEQILVALSVAGLSAYALGPWIGLAVAVVMIAVIASYRQTVHAYPSGGGDYEVATVNHGRYWGLVVGSALTVDYILLVAVSMSSAVANIGAGLEVVATHQVGFAVGAIVLLTALNLRGVRESGTLFAIPAYAFIIGVLGMVVVGLIRAFVLGDELRADSAGFTLADEGEQLGGLAFALLILRAFSSGNAALTGVEAISNGVPAFRKPKSRNAATALLLMGVFSVSMFMGLLMLAAITGVKIAESPAEQLIGAPAGYEQQTLIAQLADTVFSGFAPGFYFLLVVTALVLVLAANTAFNGFPVLGSILAQDRFLPRQLHTRGDRLAFSNGILFLAGVAIVLVVAFQAEVTRLIQLYIIGVFVSFVLSQSGMVRHWNRLLLTETDPVQRRRMRRSQSINAFGFTTTAGVLVVLVVTRFTEGAWITVVAMAVIFTAMLVIRRHYDRVSAELVPREADSVLPSRNHAIVLVSTLHLPTLRALAYARATRPDLLEAVTVNVDEVSTRRLVADWAEQDLPVRLKVIESPFREITAPVLDYVKRIRTDNPRNVVTVFIPEYVVGHWWEQVLHNQSALRLKGRLLFEPGVMVTSVPWQLSSSERRADIDHATPGSFRRGFGSGDDGAGERFGAAVSQDAWSGRELELEIGPVGHGGFCVARHEGRVVFVRHTLPGERVRAVVTEDRGGSYCRADAVAVLHAAPGRVPPPCPLAGPGRCGGCDFQHVDHDVQRALKAAVVAEQFRRIAGLDVAVDVEALPGGPLEWRTRVRLAADGSGRVGFRGHRSHAVVPIDECPITVAGALDGVVDRRWRPGCEVEVVLDGAGRRYVTELTPRGQVKRRRGSGRAVQQAAGRRWVLRATEFWQVHRHAAEVLAEIVGEWAAAPPNGVGWDLYGGVGLFAAVLAQQVGPAGRVLVVESSRQAVTDGATALADLTQVRYVPGRVERVLAGSARLAGPDVVVLDPPRRGAGKAVTAAVAARRPARIVHVACDPAALARDVAAFGEHGYRLTRLRALDTFPMTHHVECVALLEPA